MPRVGVVTTSFPRRNSDHAGRFVYELSLEFAVRGYAVDVVVPEPDDDADWENNPIWLGGITVHTVPYFRPKRYQRLFFGEGVPDNLRQRPQRLGLVGPALFSLFRAVRRISPRWDAVMSHWLLPSALITGWAAPRRLPHLAVAHSGDVHLLSSPVLKPLLPMIPNAADRFGFVSTRLEQRFKQLFSAPLQTRLEGRTHLTPMGTTLPPAAAASARADTRKRLGLASFTVLFLGRLVPIKGVELLIDALSPLTEVTLLIAGEGPRRPFLENHARAKGVNARFLGHVAPAQRTALLRAADVVVLPSIRLQSGRTEGLPLVALEAMAAGVPLIASDTGGIGDIVVHQQNGLLFPDRSTERLRECIMKLARHRALRRALSQNALKTVRTRSWSAVFPKFEALLF